MVDFHGFELPIWYKSIQEEHISTRNSAGVFDVSHMGFFESQAQKSAHGLVPFLRKTVENLSPGGAVILIFSMFRGT